MSPPPKKKSRRGAQLLPGLWEGRREGGGSFFSPVSLLLLRPGSCPRPLHPSGLPGSIPCRRRPRGSRGAWLRCAALLRSFRSLLWLWPDPLPSSSPAPEEDCGRAALARRSPPSCRSSAPPSPWVLHAPGPWEGARVLPAPSGFLGLGSCPVPGCPEAPGHSRPSARPDSYGRSPAGAPVGRVAF